MRTKELAQLQVDLSELNNHYSHFLFTSEQFFEDNFPLLKQNVEILTTDVFSENKFVEQFNVRLEEVSSKHLDCIHFIRKSLFVLSMTYLEIYFRDVYNFTKTFDESLPALGKKVSVISQVINNMEFKGNEAIDEENIATLDYLRLRRNAIVHRNPSKISQGRLLEHIKETGKTLNNYWEEHKLKIQELDFSKKGVELSRFSDFEIVDILNVIRRLTELIDKSIMNKIGKEFIQQFLVEEFYKTYGTKIQTYDDRKLCKKFMHFGVIEFGHRYSFDEVRNILGEKLNG